MEFHGNLQFNRFTYYTSSQKPSKIPTHVIKQMEHVWNSYKYQGELDSQSAINGNTSLIMQSCEDT